MKLIGRVENDSNAELMFGANVFVSDKNGKVLSPPNGVATDPDGKYELNNVNIGDYVSVSSIGFKTATYKVPPVTMNVWQ